MTIALYNVGNKPVEGNNSATKKNEPDNILIVVLKKSCTFAIQYSRQCYVGGSTDKEGEIHKIMTRLSNSEEKALKSIRTTLYMDKTVTLVEDFVDKYGKNTRKAYTVVFDEIFRILNEAKPYVDEYLKNRILKGEIKDEKQALKSIAGNSFSQILIYIFLKNKELNNIRQDIFITNKPSNVPSFKEISIINVDGEMQKPDCDLIIYSLNENNTLKKCMILSLKTSLRERAGQTYKWKLLMEIASSENKIKDKYNIEYNPSTMPLVAFATVNFYDKINNPQTRGMLKFFDQSFIADHKDADFIARMSTLPNYINENLC